MSLGDPLPETLATHLTWGWYGTPTIVAHELEPWQQRHRDHCHRPQQNIFRDDDEGQTHDVCVLSFFLFFSCCSCRSFFLPLLHKSTYRKWLNGLCILCEMRLFCVYFLFLISTHFFFFAFCFFGLCFCPKCFCAQHQQNTRWKSWTDDFVYPYKFFFFLPRDNEGYVYSFLFLITADIVLTHGPWGVPYGLHANVVLNLHKSSKLIKMTAWIICRYIHFWEYYSFSRTWQANRPEDVIVFYTHLLFEPFRRVSIQKWEFVLFFF